MGTAKGNQASRVSQKPQTTAARRPDGQQRGRKKKMPEFHPQTLKQKDQDGKDSRASEQRRQPNKTRPAGSTRNEKIIPP